MGWLLGILTLVLGNILFLDQTLRGYSWDWTQLGGPHHETVIAVLYAFTVLFWVLPVKEVEEDELERNVKS